MRHQIICYVNQEIKQEKINRADTLWDGYVGNLISHVVHNHTFSQNLFAIIQKINISISTIKIDSWYH